MGRLILFMLLIGCSMQTTPIHAQHKCLLSDGSSDYTIAPGFRYTNDIHDYPCVCDTLKYLNFMYDTLINDCLKGKSIVQFVVSSCYDVDSLPTIVETIQTIHSLSIERYIKINKALLAQTTVKEYFGYVDHNCTRIDSRLGLFRSVKVMYIKTSEASHIDFNMFSHCDSLQSLSIFHDTRALKIDSAFVLPNKLTDLDINGVIELTKENIPCFAKSNLQWLSINIDHRKAIPENIKELANIKSLRISIGGRGKLSKRREQKIYKKLKASLPNLSQ